MSTTVSTERSWSPRSDSAEPVNVGSAELVSINELVSIVEEIAGVQLKHDHDLSAPQGVRGRNSDNTMIRTSTAGNPALRSAMGWKALPGSTTTFGKIWACEIVWLQMSNTATSILSASPAQRAGKSCPHKSP